RTSAGRPHLRTEALPLTGPAQPRPGGHFPGDREVLGHQSLLADDLAVQPHQEVHHERPAHDRCAPFPVMPQRVRAERFRSGVGPRKRERHLLRRVDPGPGDLDQLEQPVVVVRAQFQSGRAEHEMTQRPRVSGHGHIVRSPGTGRHWLYGWRMRAVTISEPGGPEKLQWTEVPDPRPGAGEVLLEVVASAVNRADVLQRQGYYPPPPGAPEYPGLECSGRIVEVGEGVDGWSVGDEVCALLAGGGYAERVAVPAAQLLPVPGGVDLVEAAALPEVACTVWSNVVMVARLQAGELLLVHGGAGGIGTHAIQVGKAL